MSLRKILMAAIVSFTALPVLYASADEPASSYADRVRADGPVRYWRFEKPQAQAKPEFAAGGARVDLYKAAGPRPVDEKGYRGFEATNLAAQFRAAGGRLIVADPGDDSELDFTNGDAITLEAWVNPSSNANAAHMYIVGKGRTHDDGFHRDNQNWALRLTRRDGRLHTGLLFRDVDNRGEDDWHRWTADTGFAADGLWHHVAISYRFGEPDSIVAVVDGRAVAGRWDMGGATTDAPVVDNAPVWIGSSMGGGNAFVGRIDEVAIYRKALSAQRLADRYHYEHVESTLPAADLVAGKVAVQIIENIADRTWNIATPAARVTDTYTLDAFGFARTTRKYNAKGLIVDRSSPYLVRASAQVTLPAGEHELIVRSLNSSRLQIDGRVVSQTRFMKTGGGAHGKVPPMPKDVLEGTRVLAAGHDEKRFTFRSDGKPHLFVLESIIGVKGMRPDAGEISVSRLTSDGAVVLLTPRSDVRIALNDTEWQRYEREQERYLRQLNAERRSVASEKEAAYWTRRHEITRRAIESTPAVEVPRVTHADAVHNDIDAFILAQLDARGISPAPLADDHAFLRRVYLDTVGQSPSPAEIEAYFADPSDVRRSRVIERLLADDRWADHWTAYWQDALAENPGILKPMLNNTGPFRYFIHESFLDNKPIDRFATELIMMEGSTWYGGPAGFAMASQNDVPMAAKAHVVGRAFLGIEMSCARCHDAPFHDVTQRDLFELAAMLKRAPQKVPMTSSIPLDPAAIKRMIVEVNLKPGSTVKPRWPFADLSGVDALPTGIARNAGDARALAALRTTWHTNDRFARVIVNRLWSRYLGFGLVSRPGDWQDLDASHPALLDYLARELMVNGYDLKHVARLIFNSHTYQRAVVAGKCEPAKEHEHLFASPARRRLTAEQVVDSMYAAAGKRFDSEMLTMDRDARSPVKTMHNFGYPRRAWEFTSLSNERDRPSLAMPYTQGVLDVLMTFGWRESRQNPIDCRDDAPTVQQPAVLANGAVARRIVTLSDDSALTELALSASSPREFIDGVYLRFLARKSTAAERRVFEKLLTEGFDERVIDAPKVYAAPAPNRAHSVSWSNHLSDEANAIMIEVEQRAAKGDPPTRRLAPNWRERAEDTVWAVLNSPEFVFVP